MTSSGQPTQRRFVPVLLLLIIAVGILIALYAWKRPEPVAGPDPLRLVAQKNVAVGSLENLPNDATNDGAECVAALADISDALPEEPLGPRNLAVARLVLLERVVSADEPDGLPAAFQEAEAAIEAARQREGDTLSVRMLATHLVRLGLAGQLIDDPNRLIEAFTHAAAAAPDDPLLWSEFYVATRDLFDESSQAANREALQRAHELRPDNIVLLMEWLLTQAESRDPTIVQTLSAARQTLRPLAASIEQRGITLDDAIDAALAAVEAGDENAWTMVLARVRPLVFVVRPDTAYQLDRPRLERHVLEYVLDDFSPQFYANVTLPEPPSPTAIPVQFVAAPDALQFPSASGVRDVKLIDFDLDGRLDAICLTDEAIQVLGQEPDGSGWRLLAEAELGSGFDRLTAADLDRDENLDLVVFGAAGVRLFQNELEDDVRSLAAVPLDETFEQLRDVRAIAVADLEHDGDLDLAIASSAGISLWSNHGEFQFADVTSQSSLPPDDLEVSAIVPVDWNRDIAIDLVLSGSAGPPVGVLENIHHNRFRWRAFAEEGLVANGSTSMEVADVDGNASWDIILGDQEGVSLIKTETSPEGRVTLQDAQSISSEATRELKTWDYDNDGLLDIVTWRVDRLQVFRGRADGRFEEIEGLFSDDLNGVQACAIGDVDLDGDLDLIVAAGEGIVWYVNEGGNANHWIDVVLKAESDPQQPSQRTNSYGVGSLLELKSGPVYQPRVVTGQSTHFGLGQRERADVLRVLFTNGIPQNELTPEAGQRIITEQRLLKGSCPYLYTWTGERYEFFTDLLWASPIGLQFAEGVLAPAREWEYLLIPGDRLVAQDGEYRLQFTEELWEAAYFDEVRLIAVDHPADVAVYSNEKVGPAEIAPFKVHTVRNPQTPASATDQQGRDVLPLIAARDDRYLKAYDRRLKQGLTEEQLIEIDLGTWENPERFTLFLTGWVTPTDTSLNIAISQDESTSAPDPPSLWVPDADGEWHIVLPYMGFPGGKTKTIAVEVPGDVFVSGDYRVRIDTTMELRWDEVFFTVDEAAVESRLTEMRPAAADLHYRGFSRRIEHPQHGPESYDYEDVAMGPRWPPMRGRFTRYGDVTELLRESDDRLVVMGAGDEMTVRFKVPDTPPPDGWKRDFLLYNVGWDKDADLNTVLGQTVEPLPFGSMKSYPYPPDVTWPETPEHREYLRTFQTRKQSRGRFWRSVLMHGIETTSATSLSSQ